MVSTEAPTKSFHGRPLPEGLVAFASAAGRKLLVESLAAGHAEAFYPLVGHLHTQSEPAWCGLGTLVTVLNALEIDPGRVWKGPWRYFGEELLVCCKALDVAASEGLTLTEVACLARCNGASVSRVHAADDAGIADFRALLIESVAAPAGPFIVANYARQVLGQTGSGHFSPLAAWHAATDQVLVLDVARFKYPPHWVPVSRLWEAMLATDPETGRARGYLVVGRADGEVIGRSAESREEIEALLLRLKMLGAPVCPECPPS